MRTVKWFHLFSYLGISLLAVGLAFLVSLRFLPHSKAQNGGTEAALPVAAPPANDGPPKSDFARRHRS